jgi:hypothetical protein
VVEVREELKKAIHSSLAENFGTWGASAFNISNLPTPTFFTFSRHEMKRVKEGMKYENEMLSRHVFSSLVIVVGMNSRHFNCYSFTLYEHASAHNLLQIWSLK